MDTQIRNEDFKIVFNAICDAVDDGHNLAEELYQVLKRHRAIQNARTARAK